MSTADTLLALACAALGVGLLRLAWGHRGQRIPLTVAGWLVLCGGVSAWHGAGAAWDKAFALAVLAPSLAAFMLVASQGEWARDSRLSRHRRLLPQRRRSEPTPALRWSSRGGLTRIMLAGPVALAAALALAAATALHAPWSAADRLIAAAFALPLAWAAAALWALMGRTRSRPVSAALAGHSALGLALGALVYLICLTGTLSVLVDEMKLLEQPSPAAAALQPGQLDAAIAAVPAQVPQPSTVYALAPTTARQRLTLIAYGADGEHDFIVGAQGAITPERTPFTDFVVDLHTTLLAPDPWGSLLVGLGGAALLALLISGVIAHPRIFRDAFRLRLDGSRRLREAELHNRLSVWGLPFHLAVTLSGALFGLMNLAILATAIAGHHGNTAPVLAPLDGPTIPADPRPAPLANLDDVVHRAQAQVPGSKLIYLGVQHPGTRGARIEVEVGLARRLPRGEDFYFDAAGRQIGRVDALTGSPGLQAYSAAAQVHFGFFGGLPVRLAYVALGAALTFIAASGPGIWLERQAERGRPRPRMRLAWRAWTRGVPLALLIAAVCSPVLPVGWTFLTLVLAAQALALALWRDSAAAAHDPLDES